MRQSRPSREGGNPGSRIRAVAGVGSGLALHHPPACRDQEHARVGAAALGRKASLAFAHTSFRPRPSVALQDLTPTRTQLSQRVLVRWVFGLGAWTVATADRWVVRGFLGLISLAIVLGGAFWAEYLNGAETFGAQVWDYVGLLAAGFSGAVAQQVAFNTSKQPAAA